jgi:hypothetical protein
MPAPGWPATLTARISAAPFGQGDELHHVQGLAVLVGAWLLGVEVQDRLRRQGAQERDRGRVHRELHASSFSGRSGLDLT